MLLNRNLLRRALVAEFVGTALLLATVVGSGIMGERLSGANVAVALLANTLATGAALIALIATFGPTSGAHFNPLVTFAEWSLGRIEGRKVWLYVGAQTTGAIAGVLAAHYMFDLPLWMQSMHLRTGMHQWASEVIASFGLLTVIFHVAKTRPDFVPLAVGCYITAAYWFTASTSFANPAVTLARSLTDTFSGIRPADVLGFIASQILGAGLAVAFFRWSESMSTITIYHNPACGTSRNTLALIRNSGEEPKVIEYLKTPPDKETLLSLIAAMGISPRALLREKGTPFAELGLADPQLTDAQLIDYMLLHPILINRPIVVSPLGVRLCRPSEVVLDILPSPQRGAFVKEDGEKVIDAQGRRL